MPLSSPSGLERSKEVQMLSVGDALNVEYSPSDRRVTIKSLSTADGDPVVYEDARLFAPTSGKCELACIVTRGTCIQLPSRVALQCMQDEEVVSADTHAPTGDLIIRTRKKDSHQAAFYSARHSKCIFRYTGWAYYHEKHPETLAPAFSTVMPQKKVGPDIAAWMENPQDFSGRVGDVQVNVADRIGRLFQWASPKGDTKGTRQQVA